MISIYFKSSITFVNLTYYLIQLESYLYLKCLFSLYRFNRSVSFLRYKNCNEFKKLLKKSLSYTCNIWH